MVPPVALGVLHASGEAGVLLVSALVGAVSALLVAVVAPLLQHRIDERRRRADAREELLGKLRGIRRALPNLAYIRASAQINAAEADFFVDRSAQEWERTHNLAARTRDTERANGLLLELSRLERELHEVLGKARAVFDLSESAVAALQTLDERRHVKLDLRITPPDAVDMPRWRQDREKEAAEAVDKVFDAPLADVIAALERSR